MFLVFVFTNLYIKSYKGVHLSNLKGLSLLSKDLLVSILLDNRFPGCDQALRETIRELIKQCQKWI